MVYAEPVWTNSVVATVNVLSADGEHALPVLGGELVPQVKAADSAVRPMQ
jgi:hypothetical protein